MTQKAQLVVLIAIASLSGCVVHKSSCHTKNGGAAGKKVSQIKEFPAPTKRVVVNGDVGNQKLLSMYPECKDEYVNDCALDEVKVPCSNLCVRVCSPGRYWDEESETCERYTRNPKLFNRATEAVEACQELHPDYRLPTLHEVTDMVGYCRAEKRGKYPWYSCRPYHHSAIYYVVDVGMMFDYLIDVPGRCPDDADPGNRRCGWVGRLNGGRFVDPSTFGFGLRQGGHSVASAICVREVTR